jgi:hypothetical protein
MQNYFKKNKFAVNFKIQQHMIASILYPFYLFIFKVIICKLKLDIGNISNLLSNWIN